MKVCFSCYAHFEADGWSCPACQESPVLSHGFYAFAPELSESNGGLRDDAHHCLDAAQESSFWFRKRNQIIQDTLLRYFSDAESVLEIGCGSGYVLEGIRAVLPKAKLTATEIYAYGLAYAVRRVGAPCEFLQADARRLPFKQEFDLVGAFDVIEHIEEDELVIQNIKKSLKPGGGVLLTVPQHQWLWSDVDVLACHKRRYGAKQMRNLLVRHGFEVICDTSFMFFLLPAVYMQRKFSNQKSNASRELNLPSLIDGVFSGFLEIERIMIKLGVSFPIGSSRLVAARLK